MRTQPALYAALLAAACFAVTAHAGPLLPSAPAATPMAEEGDKGAKDGGHKHEEGGHEHKEGEDEHKGERKDLGEKKLGGYTVKAAQFGEVKAGEEAVFVVTLSGGSAKPKAVRGWVGVESGERSIKTKAEDEGSEYHLHHQVSKPLPKRSKLWLEVDTTTGKQKVSFDVKP